MKRHGISIGAICLALLSVVSMIALADEWRNYTAPSWRSVDLVTLAPDGSIWANNSYNYTSGFMQVTHQGGVAAFRHHSLYNAIGVPYVIRDIHANLDGLWAASYYGLVLYKGIYTVNYTEDNSPLVNDNVSSLCGGRDDSLWIGSWGAIYRLEDGQWSSFTSASTILPIEFGVQSMAFEIDSNVLACQLREKLAEEWLNCLYLYVEDTGEWLRFAPDDSGMPNHEATDMVFDHDARLWMALGGAVVVFDGESWTRYSATNSGIPSPGIEQLAVSHEGDIYGLSPGNSGGVCKFIDNDWVMLPVHAQSTYTEFRKLLFDAEGALWVFTSDGFIRLHEGEQTLYYPPEIGLIDAEKHHKIVTSWRSDAVWIAGYDSGLCRFDDAGWQVFTPEKSGLHSPEIIDMHEAPDGSLWVLQSHLPDDPMPDKFSLDVFDGAEWTNFSNGIGYFDGLEARCIHIDPDYNVWIGAKGGVLKFDWEYWRWLPLLGDDLSNYVTALGYNNKSGVLCAGSFGKLHFLEDSMWRVLELDPNDDVRSLAYDHDGVLWGVIRSMMGGQGRSVFCYDGETVVIYNSDNAGVSIGYARQVAVDSDNVKWFAHASDIGASGAVTSFDGVAWKKYTSRTSGLVQAHGERDAAICSVACAPNGDKWFGSSHYGLSRLSNVGQPDPLPSIQIHLNQPSYQAGDMMSASLVEANLSSTFWDVSIIIAVMLPDRTLLYFPSWTGGMSVFMSQSIRPGTLTQPIDFFETEITEALPAGEYAWFAALANETGIVGQIASAAFKIGTSVP